MPTARRRASPGFGGRPGRSAAAAFLLAAALFSRPELAAGATLEDVRARGVLRCGVSGELPGLSRRDAEGDWQGFDIDVCRALAAAVLPEAPRVEIVVPADAPLEALAGSAFDLLLSANAGPSAPGQPDDTRPTAVLLVEGQGVMATDRSGIGNARDLDGARICLADAAAAGRLRDLAARLQITVAEVSFPGLGAAADAFFGGACAALTGPRIALAAARAAEGASPAAYRILADLLSRGPLGPRVRAGDQQWLEIVRWTAFALIEAEERGVTAANAAERRATAEDPAIARFLGSAGNIGAALGLPDDWVVRAVVESGNYGEIYARNLGADSPLLLERGPNALWLNGGLLQAMPFQ